MNVRVRLPTSPTSAGLVLAAERAADMNPSEPLGSWLKAQHGGCSQTSFVDPYGRILSEPTRDALPLDSGADHVLPAWRASFDDRMRELTTQAQAMVALSLSTRHAKTSLRTMLTLVRVATRLRRMTVFVDSTGQASGALTWLHISPRTQNRIQQSPAGPLHPSEWNEGQTLWIRDIAFRSLTTSDGVELVRTVGALVQSASSRVLLTDCGGNGHAPGMFQLDCHDESGLTDWLHRIERSEHRHD